MTETKPQMEPGGFAQAAISESGGTLMPSASPPTTVASVAGGTMSVGSPFPTMVSTAGTAPSLPIEGVASGVSTWQNDKRISSLWSINQNRNSWVGVAGIGWKKLANNSDSAIVALTMLSAHAREKESPVNYREESDGMIYEMYVW
jgi:hypothetical protein